MSWSARRYREVTDIGEVKKLGDPNKLTRHHQPPRHPDKTPRIIKVNERTHRAFHCLFGNPPTLETCVRILMRDWFPD